MMLSWMFVPGWGDSMGNVAPNSARHFDLVRTLRTVGAAMAVATVLAACGGGGEGPVADAPVADAPVTDAPVVFTLTVRMVDSSGQPIADVGVDLNGGFAGME